MIEILPFQPEYQAAVRALILDGLEEHWGVLDDSKNPDLDDIATSYQKGVFFVANLNGAIIGTGAFLPRSDRTVEVIRMSVARHLRRHGIGKQILNALCSTAYQNGFQRVVLETTETWRDAVSFYRAYGFRMTHHKDGDVYFAFDLEADDELWNDR
jgi:GNAT superfamily N-acetyltransferase